MTLRDPRRFSRRRLLADLGFGAALLPLLQGRRARAALPFPKRLVVVSWTNGFGSDESRGGNVLGIWPQQYSKTDETVFSLREVLRPLEPHKRDIILVGGLELRVTKDDRNATAGLHHSWPHLLTGDRTFETPPQHAGAAAPRGAGNAISVDQFVADAIMKRSPTALRSLELGLYRNAVHRMERYISFRGPAINGLEQGNLPQIDPDRVHARIFGAAGVPGVGDAQLLAARKERKSVLDLVGRDLEALGRRLGTEDRSKIDQHLMALRQTEKELEALAATGTRCKPGTVPAPAIAYMSAANVPAVSKVQIDLMVAALACDVTRVATYYMGDAGNDQMTFPWLGQDFQVARGDTFPLRGHHDVAHAAYSTPEHTRRKMLVDQWFVSQVAYLIDRLKQIPEGAGTMLDNTIVCCLPSGAEGNGHSVSRTPCVLAGRAGGYFRTGRYVRLGEWASTAYNTSPRLVPHNGVLVALANAMDVPTETFGDPRYGGEHRALR